jgi:YidC/Oxa1 family membrane protein insertase
MQQRNLLLFFALTLLLLLGYLSLKTYFAPTPPTSKPAQPAPSAEEKKPPKKKGPTEEEPGVLVPLAQRKVTPRSDLVTLGSDQRNSAFHLRVVLDPKGAGVRSVVLNKFQQADLWGRPLWLDQEKKVPAPLELVPDESNRLVPSNLLYHYDTSDSDSESRPLDTLGKVRWQVVPGEDGHVLQVGTVDRDGQKRRQERVAFRTDEIDGVRITKTYSLVAGEYHVGLEVRVEQAPDAAEGKKQTRFRYQLTGAHGLPVEGKWYTRVFQNALIALEEKEDGDIERDVQTLQEIGKWGGGRKVRKSEKNFLRYAAVAVQYFASGLVVDNEQESQDFLDWARPTLETGVTKGTVERVGNDGEYMYVILKAEEGGMRTFQVPDEGDLRAQARGLAPREVGEKTQKKHIAIIYSAASYDDELEGYPQRVEDFADPDETPNLWVEDITVRAATEEFSLEDGPVVHKYLLYNGPVKVALLGSLSGHPQVTSTLDARYTDRLHLNTLTDYHSPGFFGRFASSIYWTDLVIKCTNVMHWILGHLRSWIPSYGLCIIVLTILVRALMFPVSRKQAMTSLKMQTLAPEIKKLQEKHKDDRQALGMAQMELYRRHGVNPFGTCWFLVLQMPIFMGLYFALQESFSFRLASFWPTWVVNLSAPDMLLWWSDRIPMISALDSYGGLLYLGPFLNLLPAIAVTLMILQQKMLTPPAMDDQQAMQQKMMKYMMVFFGFLFYKVAAGLCVYFIASSVWGFAERALLPKKKLATEPPPPPKGEGVLQKLLARMGQQPGTGRITTEPSAPGGAENKGKIRKQARQRRRQDRIRAGHPGGATPSADGSWWTRKMRRLREWWENLLEQARKK